MINLFNVKYVYIIGYIYELELRISVFLHLLVILSNKNKIIEYNLYFDQFLRNR